MLDKWILMDMSLGFWMLLVGSVVIIWVVWLLGFLILEWGCHSVRELKCTFFHDGLTYIGNVVWVKYPKLRERKQESCNILIG